MIDEVARKRISTDRQRIDNLDVLVNKLLIEVIELRERIDKLEAKSESKAKSNKRREEIDVVEEKQE